MLYVGPASSFLVISEPQAAKHVLRATDNPKSPLYDKGLVREVRPQHRQHYANDVQVASLANCAQPP